MKTKNTKSILLVAMVIAFFGIGCEGKGKRESIRGGARDARNTDGVTPNQGDQNNPNAWPGLVYAPSSYASLFREATQDFVASFMDPASLGTVSEAYGGATGVRINSRVGATVTNNNIISSPAVGSGDLSILVWDSNAANGSASGIVVTLPLVRKTANAGTRMIMEFQDEFGYVGLDGTITGSGAGRLYQGVIYFENKKNFVDPNGDLAQWSSWAQFAIPCNTIFTCP